MKKFVGILVLLFVGYVQLLGQANTLAMITGQVIDENKEPIPGAAIFVKNESTGFSTGTVTNVNGEYAVQQIPLGSPYTIRVSYVGYGDQIRSNYTLNQGDVLRLDFQMSESSIEVAEVQVVANSMKKKAANIGAATSISSQDIATMPVNGRNFTSLIGLSPLSSGNNLGGQIQSATNYTIDGMTAKSAYASGTSNRGPYSISMEAIREFEVVTNSYDVTMGRSGGGAISAVTKSGTNDSHGSVFIYQRGDYLSSPYNTRGQKSDNPYSISQFGVTLSGPIIKDRLHYFIAWDQQYDSRPLEIANIQSAADEERLGIKKATLDDFLQIARSQYGVSDSPQVGSFDKKRNSTSLMARFDWQLNPTNLLTVRDVFNRDMNNQGTGDNSTINLYEVYGSNLSTDNSLLATLRTIVNPYATNELKVQYLYQKDHGTPNSLLPSSNIPRAIVEGVESVTSLQLGGQRYLPEQFKNHTVQMVDNFYWNTDLIDYTFGTDVQVQYLNSLATSEMNGKFFYDGLEAFRNNTPYRYAREVPVGDPAVKQTVLNAALYAQGKIGLFKGADLTLGLRGEYTYYFSNPEENPTLKQLMNISSANKVKGFQLQPRVQFSWDINDKHTDILRIGGGIMGAALNNYSMINNLEFNGMKVYSIDIRAKDYPHYFPKADFVSYRKDPSTAPGMELFDQLGIQKIGTINVNSADVKVPVAYKYNLSYTHFFHDNLRVGLSFYGTNTRNNYMYVDRNMVDDPYFRLANEGNRGVYVPAESIDAAGNTDWMQGRKHKELGRVLELVSEGKVNTYTFVVDGSWRYFKDGQVTFSYSWNDSRDNTSYNGNVANSATLFQMVVDDPRDLSKMSYSDNQWRHKVVFYGTTPSFWGMNIGVRFSGLGGTRFSAITGNINGDFVNTNDLAYIFDWEDPSVPQNIREGLISLLENPEVEDAFKDYLRQNKGKVAERNGGVNKFYGTWDLRVTKDIKFRNKSALQVSVDIFNVANLLNKSWGLSHALGKQTLYTVTGFDQATKEYRYNVRTNAGRVTPSGTPWQIQLGLKYAF